MCSFLVYGLTLEGAIIGNSNEFQVDMSYVDNKKSCIGKQWSSKDLISGATHKHATLRFWVEMSRSTIVVPLLVHCCKMSLMIRLWRDYLEALVGVLMSANSWRISSQLLVKTVGPLDTKLKRE